MYSVCLVDYNADPTASTQVPVNKELYIYDSLGTDDGLAVTEPTLTLTANSAGEFSCIIPETNYGYGRIITHRTRVVVRKNEKVIFIGRINEENRDLYLNEEIKAEGSLAVLNDTLTDKKTFTYVSLPYLLNYIFTNHNSKFPNEPWKQFNFPYDSQTDTSTNCFTGFVGRDDTDVNSNKISYYSINFYTTMDTLQELLSLANAVIKLDFNETSGMWDVYIYDKNNLPATSNQPIEFGVNLLDLVQNYDKTDFCSYVAPFGGDLIQEDKSIGEAVAGYIGNNPDAIYNHILMRGPDNYDYSIWDVSSDPDYANSGYWAFEFDIGAYNEAHPDNPLKQLYLSWRAYKFTTRNGYVVDNSWRVVSRFWDGGTPINQSLAFHELTSEDFTGEINEVIDLTDPTYTGASHIMMGGWGGLIKPLIRRDATVVEEADKLNVSGCDVIGTSDEEDLVHEAGSFYLYSKSLTNAFGRIEKKLEYDIEDSLIPMSPFTLPYNQNGIKATLYNEKALGYDAGSSSEDPDLETNKGAYELIPFNGAYSCIECELPEVGNPNRPRGVYITSRMHSYGTLDYNGKHWMINGMYAVLDTSKQLLAYKSAAEDNKGVGFTNIKREFIDLSKGQYYGAKYIRVGGYIGDGFGIECVPSDDAYSRNRLMAQAQLYLTSEQWEKVTIEATAVDLSMTSDEWDSLDVCTKAEVVSSFHGIEGLYYPITSLTLTLDSPENNTVRLGYDNDEYLSNQLSENLRLMSVEQTIEERRKES